MVLDDIQRPDGILARIQWWALALYLVEGAVLALALYSSRLREFYLFWIPLSLVLGTKCLLALTEIAILMSSAPGGVPLWLSFCNFLWRGGCTALALWLTIGPVFHRCQPYWRLQMCVSSLIVASGSLALVFEDAQWVIRALNTVATLILLWSQGLVRVSFVLRVNKSILDHRASNDVEFDKRSSYKMLRTAHFLGLLLYLFLIVLQASGALLNGPGAVMEDLLMEWAFLFLIGSVLLTLVMWTRPQWWDPNVYAANSDAGAFFGDMTARVLEQIRRFSRRSGGDGGVADGEPVMLMPIAPPLTEEEIAVEEVPMASAPPPESSSADFEEEEEDMPEEATLRQALINNNN